jgi:type I restriction enzyme M protein
MSTTTLHEAIKIVLLDHMVPMTAEEVIAQLHQRGFYSKKNGDVISLSQLYLRIEDYPNLFRIENGKICLAKNVRNDYSNILWRLKSFLQTTKSHYADILIPFVLFNLRHSESEKQLGHLVDPPKDVLANQDNSQREILLSAANALTNQQGFTSFGETLTKAIQDLRNSELDNLFRLLEDIRPVIRKISQKDFLRIFEGILFSFSGWKEYEHDFKTPSGVAKYIAKLVKISAGDNICDPFAGNASLIAQILANRTAPNTVLLQELNPKLAFLAALNMLVNGVDKFYVSQTDSFTSKSSEALKNRFDLIISHPPFGATVSSVGTADYNLVSSNNSDLLAIQLIYYFLNENGRAVVIVPESFLFNSIGKKLRRLLVENDHIEAVHSLPERTFSPLTSARASLLILNKKKTEDRRGKLLLRRVMDSDLNSRENEDQLSFLGQIEITIDVKESEENDFNLSVSRYLNRKSFGPGYLTLGSMITRLKRGKHIRKEHLRTQGFLPYITPKELSFSGGNLSPDTFEYFADGVAPHPQSIVDKESVLVSSIGTHLKPTHNRGDKKLFLGNHLFSIELNKDIINSHYLIYQLQQEYVSDQVKNAKSGMTIPFMNTKDLLEIRVKVPTLEQQQKELLSLYETENFTPRRITNASATNDLERKILSAIKHEFSNLKAIVDGDFDLIRSFINRKIQRSNLLSWDEPISTMPNSRQFRAVMDNIHLTLGEIGSVFPKLQQVIDFQKKNLTKVNTEILPFIKSIAAQFSHILSEVSVHYQIPKGKKPKDIRVNIDKNQFPIVVQNFITNSVKHGFTDPSKKEQKALVFDISVSEDGLQTEIVLMNNGKPFPEDFSFEEFIAFGSKSGESAGSGIGGYLMDRVVKNHDGEFSLISFPPDTFYYFSVPDVETDGSGRMTYIDRSELFKPSVAFKISIPNN